MQKSSSTSTAIFAAGCFWGVQYYFDQVPGVLNTEVGYIGGSLEKPTYEEVCYNNTGHAEAVKITFDPDQTSYETLLKQFFRMHDPTQLNRQGPDVGEQYRSAIFVLDEKQTKAAESMIARLKSEGVDVVTTVEPAGSFWRAEEYHQKYTEKTGHGMCHVPYEPV